VVCCSCQFILEKKKKVYWRFAPIKKTSHTFKNSGALIVMNC